MRNPSDAYDALSDGMKSMIEELVACPAEA